MHSINIKLCSYIRTYVTGPEKTDMQDLTHFLWTWYWFEVFITCAVFTGESAKMYGIAIAYTERDT